MSMNLFYSYSHKDAAMREQLAVHLAPLRRQKQLTEWHDRKILPGSDWNGEIHARLESADLILLLLSPDFLASDYCFGIEVDRAIARMKEGTARVVPIMLRPCDWETSVFSELKIVPEDAKPISSYASADEAWKEVAVAIRRLVSAAESVDQRSTSLAATDQREGPPAIIRRQARTYARLYERIRQRMESGPERTQRMEEVFSRLHVLAPSCVQLLGELASSPSPGDRLAAIAILRVVAREDYLPFLVRTVRADEPFAAYHATKALEFAAESLEPQFYSEIETAIRESRDALIAAKVGKRTDRWKAIDSAESRLRSMIRTLAEPPTSRNNIDGRSVKTRRVLGLKKRS